VDTSPEALFNRVRKTNTGDLVELFTPCLEAVFREAKRRCLLRGSKRVARVPLVFVALSAAFGDPHKASLVRTSINSLRLLTRATGPRVAITSSP